MPGDIKVTTEGSPGESLNRAISRVGQAVDQARQAAQRKAEALVQESIVNPDPALYMPAKLQKMRARQSWKGVPGGAGFRTRIQRPITHQQPTITQSVAPVENAEEGPGEEVLGPAFQAFVRTILG